MRKPLTHRFALHSIVVFALLLVLLIVSGCSNTGEVPPGCTGTLLYWGTGNNVLDLASGKAYRIEYPGGRYSPLFLCTVDSGMVLIGSRYYSIMLDSSMTSLPRSPVYRYKPLDTFGQLVKPLVDSAASWTAIDYLPEIHSYMLCGEYAGDRGLFMLDSAFVRVADYTKPALWRILEHVNNCRWLDSTSVLIHVDLHRLYEMSLLTGERKSLGRGRIVALSRDRSVIVLRRGHPNDSPEMFEVLDRASGKADTLLLGGDFVPDAAGLSPDNRYLAYVKVEGFFGFRKRLHVYDLVERRDYETPLVTARQGESSFLWLDETFPLPDSLCVVTSTMTVN